MNRRGFLKALGCIAAAPMLAKVIPSAIAVESAPVATYFVGADTVCIGHYADYISFSDLALETSIEQEISYRLAFSISSIMGDVLDKAA